MISAALLGSVSECPREEGVIDPGGASSISRIAAGN